MCPFNSWRMGGELPPACPPLSGVSAGHGQSTGAALAAEAGSCEQVGRDRGEAGRGPQSGGWRGPGLEPVGHRCRGEAKAKATGMVGREKEFSVHFVPGNCQLVEVKESSRGVSGEPVRGRVFQVPRPRRLRAAPRHLLSPGSPGRRRGVCLPRRTPVPGFSPSLGGRI